MKQAEAVGYVSGLMERANTNQVKMFLVVDEPNHLAYTDEPSKWDRILAECRPGHSPTITDRSFREMYDGWKQ